MNPQAFALICTGLCCLCALLLLAALCWLAWLEDYE